MVQFSGRFAVEREIEALARPHGVAGRQQLLAAGITSGMIDSRVGSGWLRPMHRGVYAVGPVQSDEAPEMAALLACGDRAVLSHRSAAALWRLIPRRTDAPVEVLVACRSGRARPGIRLHRTTQLMADEVTRLRRVRITTPARTLLDLASCASSRELEQAVAQAERRHVTSRDRLLALVVRHAARPGTPKLRALLSGSLDPSLTRSKAEERFLALVRRSGLPTPETNVPLHGHELDFLWRDERLAVEIDGYAFHGDRSSFEDDRRRDAGLAAYGLQVIRVTWRQIDAEPEATLVLLARALYERAGRA